MDEDFIDYLSNPRPIETKFWNDWLKNNAFEAQNYLEAVNLHRELKNQVDLMPTGDLESNWEEINSKLLLLKNEETHELIPQHVAPINVKSKKTKQRNQSIIKANLSKYLFALSSVIIFIFSLVLINSDQRNPITITTSNGQIARMLLPDGSQVTINSNTLLSYSTKGFIFKDRIINLDGEAFFEVSKQKMMGRKLDFTVVTKPASIKVTGTSFNVSKRKNKLNVFLKEGRIILNTPINGSITMKEGDGASIDEKGSLSLEKNSNKNLHLAWMDNKLIFDQTPFFKIIESIEALYGVKVVCKSQALLTKTFTGVLPADDKSILLASIRETFNLSIFEKNDTLFITQNKRLRN
jgi:ferric-dicitrate binding protein FerR (iron transport regulator)